MDNTLADNSLKILESVYDKLVNKLGFRYYPSEAKPTKTNIFITTGDEYAGSEKGTKSGAELWIPFDSLSNAHYLASKFARGLEAGTQEKPIEDYNTWLYDNNANWMAHQVSPNDPGCSEQYTYTQERAFGNWGTRNCSWQFFEYLKDVTGNNAIVSNLWQNWLPSQNDAWEGEDVMKALMRTQNWSNSQLNDTWGQFALRMAAYDFKNGAVYRKAWGQNIPEEMQRKQTVRLNAVDAAKGRYAVPSYLAPQRFGQNVVRLYPNAGKDTMMVSFQGITQKNPTDPWNIFKNDPRPSHPNEPKDIDHPQSNWRWGLVAVNPTGNAGQPKYRYIGPFPGFKGDPSIGKGANARIVKQAGETQFYLVVAATPNGHVLLDQQAYYSKYRYPWMVQVTGGKPEGFQNNAWSVEGIAGFRHRNGGGFVANTARVARTAYVAAGARVLDNAIVKDNAKILGNATIKDGAVIGENAVVQDRAVVSGSATEILGSAIVKDDAYVKNSWVNNRAVIKDNATVISSHVGGTAQIGGVAVLGAKDDAVIITGAAQFLGEAENLGSLSVNKGVFYQPVNEEDVLDVKMGAERTAPEPEITAQPNYVWRNLAPEVQLSVSATSIKSGSPLTVTANATDLDGTIASLEISVDGKPVKNASSATLQATISDLSVGKHTINAIAKDNEGLQGSGVTQEIVVAAGYQLTVSGASNWWTGLTVGYSLPSDIVNPSIRVLWPKGGFLTQVAISPNSVSTKVNNLHWVSPGTYTVQLLSGSTVLEQRQIVKIR